LHIPSRTSVPLAAIGQALLPIGRTGDVLDTLGDTAGLLLAPRIERWAVRRG